MVNRSYPLPLYYQLMMELRRRIEEGEWQAGELIPSERELCRTYGLSRMTVRQALAELVDDNLLHRDQGRGTFVSRPKIRSHLSHLRSFTEDMRARGKHPSTQVLRLEMVPARPKVGEMLAVAIETQVALAERLRLADGEPVGVECSHLHFANCQSLLQEDLSGSLYTLLVKRFDVHPTRAHEEIEASTCHAHEAQMLGTRRGQPVLRMRRQTFDSDGRPFEYVESVYRAESYMLSIELLAEEGPPVRRS